MAGKMLNIKTNHLPELHSGLTEKTLNLPLLIRFAVSPVK